jgi:CBS domain containing-hemolysin-like protein
VIAMSLTTDLAIGVLLAAAGVFLSSMYSGMEIGCYRVSEVRMRLEAERGGRWWRRLLELTRRRDRLICIVLIGNCVADYASTGGLTLAFTALGFSDGQTELYATLVLAPTIFVVGEMIPKALFQARADTLTVRWTWLLDLSRLLFTYTGLVGAISLLTKGFLWACGHRGETADVFGPRERIRAMLLDQAASGVLSRVQIEVARNILSVRSVSTRLATTPIGRVVAVDEHADRQRIAEIAMECPFSRLLVHRNGKTDEILGYLDVVEAVLSEDVANLAGRLARPAARLDADKPITASLLTMQEMRCQLGVVHDRKGRPIGIVTWKDLVEEIVGELTTEWRRIRRVAFE